MTFLATFTEQKDPSGGGQSNNSQVLCEGCWLTMNVPVVLLTPPAPRQRWAPGSGSSQQQCPRGAQLLLGICEFPSCRVRAAPGGIMATLNKASVFRAHAIPPVCK